MSTILFLVDTTASMYQTAYTPSGRLSFLSLTKRAIELFVKKRQRLPEGRKDIYMLLTFDEPPHNIKVGWDNSAEIFQRELRLLEANSLGVVNVNLKHAFDTINTQRLINGVDSYGSGRQPYNLEPATVILITEGRKISLPNGELRELIIPKDPPSLDADLTKESYRWDHRLYAIVLRISGIPEVNEDARFLPNDETNIETLCNETGGRSFGIKTSDLLARSINYLAVNIHDGCHCRIDDRVQFSNNEAWNSGDKMIFFKKSLQERKNFELWPMPESYWPNIKDITLPTRDTHPTIGLYKMTTPFLIKNFPTDEYLIETCAFTQALLSIGKNTYSFYSAFVKMSLPQSQLVHPFGYFFVNKKRSMVKLCLMPYNFPPLFLLIKSLFEEHNKCPPVEWKERFENYLKYIPSYYIDPLRKCFRIIGIDESVVQSIFPNEDHKFLNDVITQRIKIIQDKAETLMDNLQSIVSDQRCQDEVQQTISVTSFVDRESAMSSSVKAKAEYEFVNFENFQIEVEGKSAPNKKFNVDLLETPRQQLLDTTRYLRYKIINIRCAESIDEDIKHSIPISDMGKLYKDRRSSQLRRVTVESEDQNLQTGKLPHRRKRKRGPLPKTLILKRKVPPPTPSTLPKDLAGPLKIPPSYFRQGTSSLPVSINLKSLDQPSTSSSVPIQSGKRTKPTCTIVSSQCPGNTSKRARLVNAPRSKFEKWFMRRQNTTMGNQMYASTSTAGGSTTESSTKVSSVLNQGSSALSQFEQWIKSIGAKKVEVPASGITIPKERKEETSNATASGDKDTTAGSSSQIDEDDSSLMPLDLSGSTNTLDKNIENSSQSSKSSSATAGSGEPTYQPARITKRRMGITEDTSIPSDENKEGNVKPGTSGTTHSTAVEELLDLSIRQDSNAKGNKKKAKYEKYFENKI